MNSYIVMDGKKIKEEILNSLKEEVSKLKEKPLLVVIQVGSDEASNIYIKQKEKMANTVGYHYRHILLDQNIQTEDLLKLIDKLNKDPLVNGILVQMPLPHHLDSYQILSAITPFKDVDGLSNENIGILFNQQEGLYSCTPSGVMEILKRYNILLKGQNVVVIGRSLLVGKPLSIMLLNAGATVTICHSQTPDIAKYTKKADIIISCVGKPHLITGSMIKKGAIVIDVGITRIQGKICGDVDYESVLDKVSYITPVPGGIGPMTVAILGVNLYRAYRLQNK